MTNGCPVQSGKAIATELGKIVAIGDAEELKKKYPDAEFKNFPNSVLLPGIVNAHCHLDLGIFYDSTRPPDELDPEPIDFIQNLVSTIDFKTDADPKLVMGGVQKGISRLIETGVTCVGDMTHFEGTFKLLRETGLRAVVFPEILAGRGEAAQQSFEVALALAEKYTDATHDRIRVGLGPYAPYLLSRNLLKVISRHAKETSIPLMIHAAESFAEMEFFFDSQGPIATEVFPSLGWKELPPEQKKTPISFLAEIGFFEAPTTVVGALHLSGQDYSLLARNLVKVVTCPTANRLMKHGALPFGKLTEHGVPMGIGTEGWQQRLGLNMWEEMRQLTKKGSDPLPSAREALKMATVGSSMALGLDHLIGTLEEGKKADFIVAHRPDVMDKTGEDFYNAFVGAMEPQNIKLVVVNGKILKNS